MSSSLTVSHPNQTGFPAGRTSTGWHTGGAGANAGQTAWNRTCSFQRNALDARANVAGTFNVAMFPVRSNQANGASSQRVNASFNNNNTSGITQTAGFFPAVAAGSASGQLPGGQSHFIWWAAVASNNLQTGWTITLTPAANLASTATISAAAAPNQPTNLQLSNPQTNGNVTRSFTAPAAGGPPTVGNGWQFERRIANPGAGWQAWAAFGAATAAQPAAGATTIASNAPQGGRFQLRMRRNGDVQAGWLQSNEVTIPNPVAPTSGPISMHTQVEGSLISQSTRGGGPATSRTWGWRLDQGAAGSGLYAQDNQTGDVNTNTGPVAFAQLGCRGRAYVINTVGPGGSVGLVGPVSWEIPVPAGTVTAPAAPTLGQANVTFSTVNLAATHTMRAYNQEWQLEGATETERWGTSITVTPSNRFGGTVRARVRHHCNWTAGPWSAWVAVTFPALPVPAAPSISANEPGRAVAVGAVPAGVPAGWVGGWEWEGATSDNSNTTTSTGSSNGGPARARFRYQLHGVWSGWSPWSPQANIFAERAWITGQQVRRIFIAGQEVRALYRAGRRIWHRPG